MPTAQVVAIARRVGALSVRGNHDDSALAAFANLAAGVRPSKDQAWVAEGGPRTRGSDPDPDLAYLGAMPFTLELKDYGAVVVHAGERAREAGSRHRPRSSSCRPPPRVAAWHSWPGIDLTWKKAVQGAACVEVAGCFFPSLARLQPSQNQACCLVCRSPSSRFPGSTGCATWYLPAPPRTAGEPPHRESNSLPLNVFNGNIVKAGIKAGQQASRTSSTEGTGNAATAAFPCREASSPNRWRAPDHLPSR